MSILRKLKEYVTGVAEEQAKRDGLIRDESRDEKLPVLSEVVSVETTAETAQPCAEVVSLRPGIEAAEVPATSNEEARPVHSAVDSHAQADSGKTEETRQEPPPAEPAINKPSVPQKANIAIFRPGDEPTIESAAEELLQELGEIRFPVDYEKLVDALHLTLGLFDPVNKESLRNVSAAYIPVSRHIWINVRDPESRRRFTAAHMLGKAVNAPRDRAMSYRDSVLSDDLNDIIANRFAMSVLMPETDFVAAYDDMDGDATQLAEKFGVPRQIIRRRIHSLRLERVEAGEVQDELGEIIDSLALPPTDESASSK